MAVMYIPSDDYIYSASRASYPNAQRSDATRAQLIAATIHVVRAQSFAGASMFEIAKAAGVTPGALQHHFGSKAGSTPCACSNTSSTTPPAASRGRRRRSAHPSAGPRIRARTVEGRLRASALSGRMAHLLRQRRGRHHPRGCGRAPQPTCMRAACPLRRRVSRAGRCTRSRRLHDWCSRARTGRRAPVPPNAARLRTALAALADLIAERCARSLR